MIIIAKYVYQVVYVFVECQNIPLNKTYLFSPFPSYIQDTYDANMEKYANHHQISN